MDNIQDTSLPPVTVVITTHNRTKVAKAVLHSLALNLKYHDLRWCITDDRSKDGHIEALVAWCTKLGLKRVTACTTTPDRYGLGASLNNGLREAFKVSPIVLTTEDDWILEHPLDLTPYVQTLVDDHSAFAIRLAAIGNAKTTSSPYENLVKVVGDSRFHSVFNLQVALRHRRAYDVLGFYPENLKTDPVEAALMNKFNSSTNFGRSKFYVYFPAEIKQGTLDDPSLYFIHVGRSTVGHDQYAVPRRYMYLYNGAKSDRHKILVVSAGTPNLEFQYKLTNRNKELYCAKHGYDYKFIPLDVTDKQSFHSRKSLLASIVAAKEYDWVLWMDCDAWFNNFNISLDSIINDYSEPSTSMIVARDHYVMNRPNTWHDCYINSGVLLLKCDDHAAEIIKIWDNPIQAAKMWMKNFTRLNDQPYLSILLLWDTVTKEHSVVVHPNVMNTFARLSFDKQTFICHAPGKKDIKDRPQYQNHFNSLFYKSQPNWDNNNASVQ